MICAAGAATAVVFSAWTTGTSRVARLASFAAQCAAGSASGRVFKHGAATSRIIGVAK